MLSYFIKKKYITPFINNLKSQKNLGNIVFYCDYQPDKSYTILLCHGTQIIEINEKNKFLSFNFDEKNYMNWENYKDKIQLLKYEGKTFTSQSLILNISESIRHLSNQLHMSFQQTQIILNNLLFLNSQYYDSNPPLTVDENNLNEWID